jgi:hypothetical protein
MGTETAVDKLVYFEKMILMMCCCRKRKIKKIYFDKLFKYFNIRIQNFIIG